MLLALAVAQTTCHATIWATVAATVDTVVHRLLLLAPDATPVGALLDVDVRGFAAFDASSRRDVSCVTGVDDDADDDERQTENGDGERRLLHGC